MRTTFREAVVVGGRRRYVDGVGVGGCYCVVSLESWASAVETGSSDHHSEPCVGGNFE